MGESYSLPAGMREKLARPLGRVFSPKELDGAEFKEVLRNAPMLITVGDRVTETAGSMGRVPDVQVVDAKENRNPRAPPDVEFSRLIKVSNPAGSITSDSIDLLKDAFSGKKPVRVLVDGEEDLLAIPAVALAPLSSVLMYGQPGAGVVVIAIGAPEKARNRAILSEMGVSELR